MKKIIVGYSGFVGSNICANMNFDGMYDHTNVTDSYNSNPDLLIYCGVRAEKYLANTHPEQDMEIIKEAEMNIKKINPKKIVLISSIDVYKDSNGRDEDSSMDTENLQPYGYNRYCLEQWVQENYSNHLIIRLPALFGKNIKKNFFYDLLNPIPKLLNEKKYKELYDKNSDLENYYKIDKDSFYHLVNNADIEKLSVIMNQLNFSALNFTDQDATFQCFDLSLLVDIIETSLKNNINLLNVAVEPTSAQEIYNYIYNDNFNNKITDNPPYYNFKTKHYKVFNGNNGYIYSKEETLVKIKKFILGASK